MLAWKNGTISRLLWKVLQELDTKERNSIIILLASLIKFWFHFILYSCPIPSNSCIIHHIKHIKLWLTEKIKSNFEGNEHIFAGNYNFFLLILVFLTRKLKAVTECFKTRTASLIKQFGNLYNISVYEITSRKAQKITKVIVHRMRIRIAILRYKKKKNPNANSIKMWIKIICTKKSHLPLWWNALCLTDLEHATYLNNQLN